VNSSPTHPSTNSPIQRVGALGDIHGDFASVRRIMRQHPEIRTWLCVGDVANAEGRYEAFDAPLHWIKGNNENFDLIASGDLPANLHYIPNGTLQTIAGLRVAGLGGTFAPTMYDTPAAALPHPKKGTAKATELADRRRHFVREEVEACKAFKDVDVLLTHEAPRPFRVKGNDAGKTPINEILAAMKPRLHLFGHHHRFVEADVQRVRSVCLDLVGSSHLLVDVPTLEYHVVLD
jgi:Icc-related predicted phosphoesterase